MMQEPSLMDRARQAAPQKQQPEKFARPDTEQLIPKGQEDAYARIVAAGVKIMYSPGMRPELQHEIQRDVPVAQKMADAVAGLMLTMDKQAKGGLPVEAIMPAGLELLSEAADVLIAAGQPVTMDDWHDAAKFFYVTVARKFGAKDEEIMAASQKLVAEQGAQPGGEMEPGEGPAHEQAEAPDMEQQETQAEAQGLPEPDEEGGK